MATTTNRDDDADGRIVSGFHRCVMDVTRCRILLREGLQGQDTMGGRMRPPFHRSRPIRHFKRVRRSEVDLPREVLINGLQFGDLRGGILDLAL